MKNPSVLSDTGPRVSSSAFFSITSLPPLLPLPPRPCVWQVSGSGIKLEVMVACLCPFVCFPFDSLSSDPPPHTPSFPTSFPLLLLFVATLVAGVAVPVVGRVVEKHLVKSFESLREVVLEGGECSADGGRAKAVCDEGEVGEAALDARLQDGAGP